LHGRGETVSYTGRLSGKRGGITEARCQFCGETFQALRWKVENDPRRGKYCSKPCSDKGRQKRLQAECETCHRVFEHTVRKRPARFCSLQCVRRKDVSLPPRKPRIRRVCEDCGTLFERRIAPSMKPRRFCSHPCWLNYCRKHPEEFPQFRGGYEPYYGPNWAEQARRARARDHHTCQDCGLFRTRPALDVHHLQPFRLFAKDYEAANQLDNLITLCKSCHSRRTNSATSLDRMPH
jgi:5-methylcytosine-specific restriction endonuclease McrA